MFCCFRTKKDDYNLLKYALGHLMIEVEELKKKHSITKKNLIRVIDTFNLKEYVLFKTRLLTKEQTINLLAILKEKIEGKYLEPEYRSFEKILNKLYDSDFKDTKFETEKQIWCSRNIDQTFLEIVIDLLKK